MQVYGFDYSYIFFLLSVDSVNPIATSNQGFNGSGLAPVDMSINEFYTYSPTLPNFGNPYIPNNPQAATYNTNFPDWISNTSTKMDLRGFYLTYKASAADCSTIYMPAVAPFTGGYCQAFNWSPNVISTISDITNGPVEYTTETLFYAQSAYFVTIVMVQWSNVFACKSRKVTISVYIGVLHFLCF